MQIIRDAHLDMSAINELIYINMKLILKHVFDSEISEWIRKKTPKKQNKNNLRDLTCLAEMVKYQNVLFVTCIYSGPVKPRRKVVLNVFTWQMNGKIV